MQYMTATNYKVAIKIWYFISWDLIGIADRIAFTNCRFKENKIFEAVQDFSSRFGSAVRELSAVINRVLNSCVNNN